MNPHQTTKTLEAAVANYTQAPYCVAVTSCTAALLLAVAWCFEKRRRLDLEEGKGMLTLMPPIEIPAKTYVGVGHSILNAGGRVAFRNEPWVGAYQLKPLPVWDSARWFTGGLYPHITKRFAGSTGQMVCTSHHAQKTLSDTQAGCILHDDPEADAWLRRARFDGRAEGVAPKDDTFDQRAWHCYLSPDVAARLLWKLSVLPRHNEPLPWGPGTDSDYPDLSLLPIFR